MTRTALLAFAALALPHAAAAAPRTVSGTLQYQDFSNPTTFVANRPVRLVDVTIKRGSTTLGTAMTGNNGLFTRSVDVTAGEVLTLEFRAENYAANIYLDMEGDNDYILWQYQVPVSAGGTINANHVVGAPWSVHLSLLDAATYGRQYADARRGEGDDITQADVIYPHEENVTHYDSGWDEIFMPGPVIPPYTHGGATINMGWFDYSLLHELGHHMEAHISELENPGDHTACTVAENYPFAWSEGFATYFGSAVGLAYTANLIGDPTTSESNPEDLCHPTHEIITTEILYDLHDGVTAAEPFDKVSGTRVVGTKNLQRIIFEIFDDEQENDIGGLFPVIRPTTIESFHDAWVDRELYPTSHQQLDTLMFRHGVEPHARTDFRVASVTVPASISRGVPFNMTWKPTQSGYAYDEQVHARFYLFSFTNGLFVLRNQIFGAGAFPSDPSTTSLTVPSTVPAGTYFIYAELDDTNAYPESNETNNAAAVALIVN